MPCYSPLSAYQAPFPAAFGPRAKLKFTFTPGWKNVEIPCGQCIGCRLDKSRTWAARCMHEAQFYQDNSFLTLTLTDENLTSGKFGIATLDSRQLELFWKRLRKAGFKTRYYACGEYGDVTGRPHYHSVCFGLSFPDKKLYTSKNGHNLYTSETLDKIWGLGNCWIGDVTFESCAYVARYIMKKLNGKAAAIYEHEGILPEFCRMSRGKKNDPDPRFHGGLGSYWYSQYYSDLFPNDICVIRGDVLITPPKFYSQKYALQNPTQYAIVKSNREKRGLKYASQNTPEKRLQKQEVKLAQLTQLLRSIH